MTTQTTQTLTLATPSHVNGRLPAQPPRFQVAILLPCHNEGLSIRQVVTDFRAVLPEATVFVYDNCSSDNTADEAQAAGAIVRHEPWPGKGNVVRRMFADIEADVYVMADGDGTYEASMAATMVHKMIDEHLDMVVGTRRGVYDDAHRKGHGFGNWLFNKIYRQLFGRLFTDIFSGYRVFSRRFVKTFPAVAAGFEIETEMAVHASQLRMPIVEIPTTYGSRQDGSVSKLRTFRDASRILRTLLLLFKEIRPAAFFAVGATFILLISFGLGLPVVYEFLETGLVRRIPTAILASALVLLSALTAFCGLILDSVARGRLEIKRLSYLGMPQFSKPPTVNRS